MEYQTIELHKQKDVVTVSLNRPDVHNAMSETLMKELTNCFKDLSNDASVRAIILTGKGKSFCAGADLNWMKSMANYSKEENIKDSRLLLNLFEAIYSCPKPVIGRINGHAFGGGLGLIAVCDIAIAIPELKFAFSEVNLGIIPLILVLTLGFTTLPNIVLIFIFYGTTFCPFLIFFIFFKNTGTKPIKTLKIIFGAIFIGMGYFFRPEIAKGYDGISESFDVLIILTNISAPILFGIGTLLIFDSYRRELNCSI